MNEEHPEVILSIFAVVQDQDKSIGKRKMSDTRRFGEEMKNKKNK
jgi:hypothetical protein